MQKTQRVAVCGNFFFKKLRLSETPPRSRAHVPHTALLRRLCGVNCTACVLPLRGPGVAALVPRALPLATELLPLTGLLKEED